MDEGGVVLQVGGERGGALPEVVALEGGGVSGGGFWVGENGG